MNELNINLPNNVEFVPWYKQKKKALFLAIISLIVIFLVYFCILVYNEYQNINRQSGENKGTLEQLIAHSKKVNPDDPRLYNKNDAYLGNPAAKVKIVEFGDFQCPFCRDVMPTIRKIADEYGNKIQFSYRYFPLSSIHPEAQQTAQAAACANLNGKFWPYHDKLYINQENLGTDYLTLYAKQLDINQANFNNCLYSNLTKADVDLDYQDGKSLGVSGTPTFFINGVMFAGVIDYSMFKNLVEYFLNENNNINN